MSSEAQAAEVTAETLRKLTRMLRREMAQSSNNARADAIYLDRIIEGLALPPSVAATVTDWSLAPELCAWVADLIRNKGICRVLEFGSGFSTLVIAASMRALGGGTIVSVEHDSDYFRQTAEQVTACGLDPFVTLIHSPLTDLRIDGGDYSWYDIEASQVQDAVNGAGLELVLIDGPPGNGGHCARYPAFPFVRPLLSQNALVILDDGDRDDEQEIARKWVASAPDWTFSVIPTIRHSPIMFHITNSTVALNASMWQSPMIPVQFSDVGFKDSIGGMVAARVLRPELGIVIELRHQLTLERLQSEYEASRAALEANIDTLHDTLNAFREQAAATQTKSMVDREQIEALQKQIATSTAKNVADQQQISALLEQVTALEERLTQALVEQARLEKLLTQNESARAALQDELQSVRARSAANIVAAPERQDRTLDAAQCRTLLQFLSDVQRREQRAVSSARDAQARAERVKSHLSYRVGAAILQHYRSLGGLTKLPFVLARTYREFKLAKPVIAKATAELEPVVLSLGASETVTLLSGDWQRLSLSGVARIGDSTVIITSLLTAGSKATLEYRDARQPDTVRPLDLARGVIGTIPLSLRGHDPLIELRSANGDAHLVSILADSEFVAVPRVARTSALTQLEALVEHCRVSPIAVQANLGLLTRSLLRDVTDDEMVSRFPELRRMVLALGCSRQLCDEAASRLQSMGWSARLTSQPVLISQLLQLFSYHEINADIGAGLITDCFTAYRGLPDEERLETVSMLLPVLYETLGQVRVRQHLHDIGVSEQRAQSGHAFIQRFCQQPAGMAPLVSPEFGRYLAQNFSKYENILALFLYELHVTRSINKETILKFFTIKHKLKVRFISAIRRYSALIVGTDKGITSYVEIKHLVKKEIDVKFVALLGLSINADDIRVLFSDNALALSLEGLAYCRSQYGHNASVLALINDMNSSHGLGALPTNLPHSLHGLFEGVAQHALPTLETKGPADLISVVMATHNPDLRLLDLAIRSVLNQTHRQVELILVDDCSQNSTEIAAVAASYSGVRYMRMETNSGPYVCRNAAIEIATGSYIAFQDDDDVSHPQRIEFQYRLLRTSEARLVTVCHVRFDELGNVQVDLNESIFSDGPVTMLFHRSLLQDIGPFKQLRSRGDVEFRRRCIRKLGDGSYQHLTLPLYYSRGSHLSLSSTFEYNSSYSRLELQREMMAGEII